MDTPYSAELFQAHVGSSFFFSTDGGQFPLLLEQVACKPGQGGPFRAFTLIFSSDKHAFFEQGTYPLAHPGLGQLDIFITAIGESETQFRYQAPFSVRNPAPC